jgi:Na+/melibiose symporter-like transporter
MLPLGIRLEVLFLGLVLGSAGVPIYLHLPRFATADLGLGLSLVGLILIGIRVMDFAQDPLLGRIVDRFPFRRIETYRCALHA